jgi:3-oxoacyl-[acyl-carrier protein] reductase
LVEKHTPCTILPGDLTDLAFLEKSVSRAAEIYGGIDVLINNAGAAANHAFENVSVEEFDKIMAINVKVPFFLTQLTLPLLKKSANPTIINIASVTGHAGYPQQSVYSASKHALLGMTKSIASEYYKENIRVHAISPGGVYTDMVKVTRPDLKPDGMIMPEDIAEIVYFFLANRGNAVVDEILVHRVGKEPFQV